MDTLNMLQNEKNLLRKLSLCMTLTEQYPHFLNKIGIFWINNTEFIINTSICGKFINIDPNTINHNLNDHEFEGHQMKENHKYYLFQKINKPELCKIHWTIRSRSKVTKDNLFEIAPSIPYVKKTKRQKGCPRRLYTNNKILDPNIPYNNEMPEMNFDNTNCLNESQEFFSDLESTANIFDYIGMEPLSFDSF